MAGGSADISTWILAIAGAVTAVAGAVGLPKIISDRRERKAAAPEEPVLTNLLPAPVQLVDRVPQRAQIRRYLAAGEQIVTVEGPRGVGKSALVLDAAHEVAAGGGRRRKPAAALFWLDAQNSSPDLVDLARKLSLHSGQRALSAAPATEKADALRSYLAANPTILVVDNLRLTSEQPAPLRDLLGALPSGSRAIISANTVGILDSPRVTVPELAPDDATTLIVREAQRSDVPDLITADEAVMTRVHRLVGGNPRAIRLFVTACAGRPGTVAEVLDEIESGTGDLDTLYGVVWTELAEPARAALAACALLTAGADLSQVSIAVDLPERDTRETLRRLWTDGLLESGQALERTVYRCPPALRRFVLDHTDADRLATARTRLATALTARFSKDWEDAAGAAPQVEAIRVLIRELVDNDQHRLCLDLFAATYDLLFTLGLFDDRIALGWITFDAARALDLAEEQSLVLSVISSTHAIRGEDLDAEKAVRIGMEIARAAGSAREIARQLRCEGFRLYRARRVREALDIVLAEDAEGMARGAGDPNNMIDILSLIGAAYFHLGELDACEETVLRFRDECERMPWERGMAYALRDLAEVRLMRGDSRAAEKLAAQAETIAGKHRDTRQQARINLTLARLDLFTGRMRRAKDVAAEAARAAGELQLYGEHAEALAVGRAAGQCLWLPWLRRKFVGKPRLRFTDWTTGGD
ncbi:ATP-binding protein [Amycolatopsis sp. SID8362]|uniref:ATP-binding protein n=1 Tax=Amycolatopsis sp. SID8362 TaxID=2690346 RepID=UPI001370C8BA|nr:ATP-binding protein [Amycolatopsis sp. SID8362]NBH10999.1 hypothetical protein [Amycolatopsis sp. SID8362]NED47690.1 hypothetical protein [Amycolatopsis sp. SID8362]